MGLVAPLAAVLAAAPRGVLGLLGPRYAGGSQILLVFSLSIIPVAGLSLASTRLNAEARFHRLLAAGLARLGLLLALVALLAGSLGLLGVAAAYTVSSLAGLLLAAPPSLLRVVGLSFLVYGGASLLGRASLLAGAPWPAAVLAALASGYAASHLARLASLREASRLLRGFASRLPSPRLRAPRPGLGLDDLGRGFAAAFMVLLLVAAAFLAWGDEAAANKLAEYAYYMLVLSVVFLLVDTARSGGDEP